MYAHAHGPGNKKDPNLVIPDPLPLDLSLQGRPLPGISDARLSLGRPRQEDRYEFEECLGSIVPKANLDHNRQQDPVY